MDEIISTPPQDADLIGVKEDGTEVHIAKVGTEPVSFNPSDFVHLILRQADGKETRTTIPVGYKLVSGWTL